MSNNKIFIYFLVLVQAFVWGLSFLGTKAALDALTPIGVIAARWTFAFFIMLLLVILKIIRINMRGKNLWQLLKLSLLSPCIFAICEVLGISMVSTLECAVVTSLTPVVVLIFSVVFLKSKINFRSGLGVIMAFSGIAFATMMSPDFSFEGRFTGYIFLLLSVSAGATYTIYLNSLKGAFTPMEVTIAMAASGTVFFNVILLFQGNLSRTYTQVFAKSDVFLSVMFLALCCTVICYIIYSYVITKLPAHQAAAIQLNLTTLVGVLSGILVKGDPYGWYTVVGMMLIILGIVEINIQEGRKAQGVASEENAQ